MNPRLILNLFSLWLLMILTLIVIACQSPRQRIAKLWLFTHYSDSTDGQREAFSPTSFLLLLADGTCTMDFGHYKTGHWVLVADHLTLTDAERKTSTYQVSTDGHDLRLTASSHTLINFEAAPVKATDDLENPFAKVNNQWRIKAMRPETPAEIRNRIKNHIEYWISYFTWALNNHLDQVDVRSLPTPIKIYSNGFTIKPLSSLPQQWIKLFYSEADCIEANQYLGEIVRSHNIAWPHTENKYKMFIGAFEQLRAQMQ